MGLATQQGIFSRQLPQNDRRPCCGVDFNPIVGHGLLIPALIHTQMMLALPINHPGLPAMVA
jgi:hypothetical protein